MISELKRYIYPIRLHQLPRVLTAPDSVATESAHFAADLEELKSRVEEIMAARPEQPSTWDTDVSETLHACLHGIPVRNATDMRMWHWLCTNVLSGFVWRRWAGGIPEKVEPTIPSALAERFIGTSSLRGISRNALARLYWCAHSLYSDAEKYDLVRRALANQDLFQAVFERALGLYPPAARACFLALQNNNEDERRAAVRRLNHYLTTITVETLDETEITRLLFLTE